MNEKPKYKILVVDDEKVNLIVLNYILGTKYAVITAASGHEALRIAREESPDLILLDVIMPDMDGFATLAALKASDITQHIPVIFVTGLTSEEDEEKGLSLGAVDYITKPYKRSIVMARVKTHLQIVSQMRTIERLSSTDALTNIPNRRHFDMQIQKEWSRAKREQTHISLLMLDVDDFKNYNDTYGHPQGDVLLQLIAKTIEGTLKRPGDFAARVGGEEFSALLPNTDLTGALIISEEIRKNIIEVQKANYTNPVPEIRTVSIGVVSQLPEKDDMIDAFISEADMCLYKAKTFGKNQVCHPES